MVNNIIKELKKNTALYNTITIKIDILNANIKEYIKVYLYKYFNIKTANDYKKFVKQRKMTELRFIDLFIRKLKEDVLS